MFLISIVTFLGVFHPTYGNYEPQIRYEAPDDCNYKYKNNLEISLVCRLRTINSEFDTTNFTVIPSEHTISLAIQCFEDVLAKSRLEARSFAHLVQLRELSLEFCKIGAFNKEALGGLIDLQNLTIRTHNINWPELNLDIEADVFHYTKNIKHLDLSMNNMWTLPENLFCSLSGLNFLNISGNRLQDISDLGFRETPPTAKQDKVNLVKQKPSNCSLDLETLDASNNNFVLLPVNSFSLLKRMKYLKLHNNELTMVADEALVGLRNLQVIDLSSNKMVTLPSGFFKDPTQTIQEIYLQNNSISVLSNNLFSNLEQLHLLDLSMNQLTSKWINRNTFSGIIRLVLLNLSNNRITKLGPEIFTDLYTLQILNLRYNQLENLAADTFSPMNNLHTLLLSHNKIKYLDAYSLNGLGVLSLLSLDNNLLTGVHPEAFRNCSSLQDLNLNANELTKVPAAMQNMRLLRTVDLGENKIAAIEEPGFAGMNNLYGLRLIGNVIESLSKKAFKNLPSLQILNMAKNRIQSIEEGTFDETVSVQAIRLDGNQLTNVSGLFHTLPNLLWLNISDNQLTGFDFSQIPLGLQWLDLHKNAITQLSNIYGLDNQLRLQTLDASFNLLVEVTPLSIPNSVELLFLNDNLINNIKPHTFMQKSNLTRVDLYANRITSLDVKALRLMPVSDDRQLPEFYIGGNPFICDCNIDWLQKINQVTTRQYPRIMDIGTIYCKLLYNRDRSYVQLIDAEPVNFLCSYKTHCFALCHCCDFDACDCEMTCPNNCTCFHDQSWSTNVVECSAAGYREIPSTIPMDTSELYIDGNDLGELSGHSFIGRKNLMVLYANHSKIHSIYNTTFIGLKRLTLLHLEFNDLRKFTGSEFVALDSLRELYLQNNKISNIASNTFNDLRKLEVLRIDGNRLVNFEAWQLTANPYLVEIGLASNPWTCDCTFVNQLKIYLDSNTEKLIDANMISCAYKNTTSILKYDKSGVKCTLREGYPMVRTQEIEDLLPFLLTASLVFIGFFALVFAVFCYRRQLKLFAHSKCLFCCCRSDQCSNEYDKEQLYDAYVIYSQHDENFANQVMAQTLENDIGYRLCLHHRDFNPNAYIFDTVIEAIERSKRTILVLSKNFLYNEWTRFEFKGAIHEVLKRRRKLIIILYGELPQRDLDADMRLYLQNSLCIEWYDKKFWQKVRIALPHIKKKHCLTKDSSVNIYATTHNYNTVARRMIVPACNGPVGLNNFQRNCDSYEPVVCSYNTMTATHTASRMAQRQHVYEDPVNCFVDQQRPSLPQNNDNFCCNVAIGGAGESFECTSSSNCSSASTTARESGGLLDTSVIDAPEVTHIDDLCKNDLNCSCNESIVNNRASSYSDNSSATINNHVKEKNKCNERNKSEKNNPLMDNKNNTYNNKRSPQEIWA